MREALSPVHLPLLVQECEPRKGKPCPSWEGMEGDKEPLLASCHSITPHLEVKLDRMMIRSWSLSSSPL